jgi:hypothetical protein
MLIKYCVCVLAHLSLVHKEKVRKATAGAAAPQQAGNDVSGQSSIHDACPLLSFL